MGGQSKHNITCTCVFIMGFSARRSHMLAALFLRISRLRGLWMRTPGSNRGWATLPIQMVNQVTRAGVPPIPNRFPDRDWIPDRDRGFWVMYTVDLRREMRNFGGRTLLQTIQRHSLWRFFFISWNSSRAVLYFRRKSHIVISLALTYLNKQAEINNLYRQRSLNYSRHVGRFGFESPSVEGNTHTTTFQVENSYWDRSISFETSDILLNTRDDNALNIISADVNSTQLRSDLWRPFSNVSISQVEEMTSNALILDLSFFFRLCKTFLEAMSSCISYQFENAYVALPLNFRDPKMNFL